MENREIIGVGYTKDVKIGESFLQESVVSMWEFPPTGAFVYYSKSGSQMILQEYTRVTEDRYRTRNLTDGEITPEIKQALIKKGYEFLNSQTSTDGK